jgi:hypothetical protein
MAFTPMHEILQSGGGGGTAALKPRCTLPLVTGRQLISRYDGSRSFVPIRPTSISSTSVHKEETNMTIRIGDVAPDFTAETTEGTIKFHHWIGDKWAILFSHPKDFTPICTTELGYMAGLKPEFDKRNTKIIGLSVDPVSDHKKWVEIGRAHV